MTPGFHLHKGCDVYKITCFDRKVTSKQAEQKAYVAVICRHMPFFFQKSPLKIMLKIHRQLSPHSVIMERMMSME